MVIMSFYRLMALEMDSERIRELRNGYKNYTYIIIFYELKLKKCSFYIQKRSKCASYEWSDMVKGIDLIMTDLYSYLGKPESGVKLDLLG